MPTSRSRSRALLAGVIGVVLLLATGLVWYVAAAGPDVGPLEARASEEARRLDRLAALAEIDVGLSSLRTDLEDERARTRLERRTSQLVGRLEAALAVGEDGGETRDEALALASTLRDQVRQGDPAARDTATSLSGALRALHP